jgi:hypothetical protein
VAPSQIGRRHGWFLFSIGTKHEIIFEKPPQDFMAGLAQIYFGWVVKPEPSMLTLNTVPLLALPPRRAAPIRRVAR